MSYFVRDMCRRGIQALTGSSSVIEARFATIDAEFDRVTHGRYAQPPRCRARGCGGVAQIGPCPECQRWGAPLSYFCSQDCFSRSWADHSKLFHNPGLSFRLAAHF